MAAEEVTVPTVYLKNPMFWKSAHHRAYFRLQEGEFGPDELPACVEFWGGKAINVPIIHYRALEKAGMVTTERPEFR
jgi:hypothetical protein